nr:hypothetical protein [Tanacetum cinerariifolium]
RVVIRDPKEELPSDTAAEISKVKDKGKGILIEAPKPMKKKDQIEMDAETLKSREEMEEEDEDIIKSINETRAQKAAKRRKLHEQAKEDKDLKKQLEVVDDEDDDVFIEATPIGRKVPVVDYEIVMINNKPRYKIIKADGTHYRKEISTFQVHSGAVGECGKIESGRRNESKDCHNNIDAARIKLKLFKNITAAEDITKQLLLLVVVGYYC